MTNEEHLAQAWIRTVSGKRFHLLDPRPSEIDINDIAHALSMICRFTGHTLVHYSVAEHSVRVQEIVPQEDRLWALLHDGAEAYCSDLNSPLKRAPQLAGYRDIEARVEKAIFARFGLFGDMPASVKIADRTLCSTEARDLMHVRDPAREWSFPSPLHAKIKPLNATQAKDQFLRTFHFLYRSTEKTA